MNTRRHCARHSVRYESGHFPECMSTVAISWSGNISVNASVANYCALGIQVMIPQQPFPTAIPKKKEHVKVRLPIDVMWFTGMCVYTADEADGATSMGIFFSNPREQNYLHKLLVESIDEPPRTCSFISHEWEELVGKLCASDDPKLKAIGYHEYRLLQHNMQGNCFIQDSHRENPVGNVTDFL